MARPEKVAAVADIKQRIEDARAVFLTEYAGLSVKAQQQLRRGLRGSGAEFQVVKMTLAQRAVSELDIEGLDEFLVGPTAIAYANEDAVGTAKVLKDFASENDRLVIKVGMLGREILAPERIRQLAELEPRDVLLAKIAGAAKAPLANLAGLFSALTRNTASVVKQLLDARQAAVGAPAEEPEPEAAAPAEPEAGTPEAAAPADDAPIDVAEPEAATAEPEAATDEPEAATGEPETEDAGVEDVVADEDDEPKATATADPDAGAPDPDDDEAAEPAEEE
jgi:large subunit ribosomal protein L10